MEAIFGDLLKSMLALGTGGIIAAIMTFMWKSERDERREVQSQNVKLLEDTISSRMELANALAKIAVKIGA